MRHAAIDADLFRDASTGHLSGPTLPYLDLVEGMAPGLNFCRTQRPIRAILRASPAPSRPSTSCSMSSAANQRRMRKASCHQAISHGATTPSIVGRF
ncbi:hypothetical protein X741_30300 [Mesorhizobium sp. LNHC229A00]|nr:hypothetical protein X741_30300 [Mesorhizobium sp. LNHC229A00]